MHGVNRMGDLSNKDKTEELPPSAPVSGSVVFRMVSPEDRKKIKEIAKRIAKEQGLIITVIEK